MKFTVSTSLLQKQLLILNGVISNSPIMPILDNFLFDLDAGTLTITASDLQTSIISKIEVNSEESGTVAVPAKILTDTLKSLSEQPITIEVNPETFIIEIHSSNGRYKLAGENAMDYPKMPKSENSNEVTIPSDVLSTAINNTLFAVSKDDIKPAMTGVFTELNNDNITFVATDGNKLIRYTRSDVSTSYNDNMIIPQKALSILKNALPHDDSPITIEFSKSNAFFVFDGTKVICRLIDERFPDYQNAIPKENPNVMMIDKSTLLSSLNRTVIYSNKNTNLIRLAITQDELTISAEDIDYSNEADEKIPCQYSGEEMEIGFNAKYLIEMLKNMSSKEVKIELSAANRAGLFIPTQMEEEEDVLMLLMPVMLNSYT